MVVTEQYGGVLPRQREDLLALPGIGPYTADAIIAFAYRERSTVLDTNIRRVLCRINGTALPPATLRKEEIARAEALVPQDGEEAAQWNAALMELGALVCTSRNPACSQCPLAAQCQWLAAGQPMNAAPRKPQGFTGTHREARGKIIGSSAFGSLPDLSRRSAEEVGPHRITVRPGARFSPFRWLGRPRFGRYLPTTRRPVADLSAHQEI